MSAPDPTVGERGVPDLLAALQKSIDAARANHRTATPDADDASEPCLCGTDFTCLAREHDADEVTK